MEQEERIRALEEEVRTLKREIGKTLIEIQKSMPDKQATPMRWEKKAWLLALFNIILAIILFTNIFIYLPNNFLVALNPTLATWLRSLWLAIAFIWLLLQMYPLALLLVQDDQPWQGVVWRNAITFLRARPGLLVLLTLSVLVVALVDTLVPAAWLLIALALLVIVAAVAAQTMLASFRAKSRG